VRVILRPESSRRALDGQPPQLALDGATECLLGEGTAVPRTCHRIERGDEIVGQAQIDRYASGETLDLVPGIAASRAYSYAQTISHLRAHGKLPALREP
jgi:hypothetical protein